MGTSRKKKAGAFRKAAEATEATEEHHDVPPGLPKDLEWLAQNAVRADGSLDPKAVLDGIATLLGPRATERFTKELAGLIQPADPRLLDVAIEHGFMPVILDGLKRTIDGAGKLLAHSLKNDEFNNDAQSLFNISREARVMGNDELSAKAAAAAVAMIEKKHSV